MEISCNLRGQQHKNSTIRLSDGACVITESEVRDRTAICKYNKGET